MKVKKEPQLIPFNCIYVNIPRKYILKLYERADFLTHKETRKIIWKLQQIERAENQLKSARSLVEAILLKKPSNFDANLPLL